MRTEMVVGAIEMPRWSRQAPIAGLQCHSDAGLKFTSLRYGERLAEIRATPAKGTVTGPFDNALVESANGPFKAELIRGSAISMP